MVVVGGKAKDLDEARQMLLEVIDNGKALEILKDFIKSQGGNPAVVDSPELLPQATFTFDVPSKEDGYISFIEADEVGTAAMILGAGRATKESVIDLAVGLVLHKKVGDSVKVGESLATIYSNNENVQNVLDILYAHIEFSKEEITPPKLIEEIITH
jgi:pyrimidine-nucleoside phosphorylase